MQQGLKNVATRMVNAENNFAETLVAIANITNDEAFKVIATYRKLKLIKMDAVGGRISVKHGAYLDRDVILRALAA